MWDITLMNRDEMVEQLKTKECQVVFTKVNGDERNMRCTLVEAVLPPTNFSTDKTPRPVNQETIVAWDVVKEAFRSFRVENVVSFS
jgi:hypothetical protein|tara:strand:+ start:1282 stop:1539 length:258 start_codon:yes stop_codon:yes gene_type:complete